MPLVILVPRPRSAGGSAPEERAPLRSGYDMVEAFKNWTTYLASGVEASAAVIIGLAALQATWMALALFLRRQAPPEAKEHVRLQLGRWLALGLEFELAADILRTAVAPTWDEIGQLAAIVVLRTALNYFLQQEIDKAADRERRTTSDGVA